MATDFTWLGASSYTNPAANGVDFSWDTGSNNINFAASVTIAVSGASSISVTRNLEASVNATFTASSSIQIPIAAEASVTISFTSTVTLADRKDLETVVSFASSATAEISIRNALASNVSISATVAPTTLSVTRNLLVTPQISVVTSATIGIDIVVPVFLVGYTEFTLLSSSLITVKNPVKYTYPMGKYFDEPADAYYRAQYVIDPPNGTSKRIFLDCNYKPFLDFTVEPNTDYRLSKPKNLNLVSTITTENKFGIWKTEKYDNSQDGLILLNIEYSIKKEQMELVSVRATRNSLKLRLEKYLISGNKKLSEFQ